MPLKLFRKGALCGHLPHGSTVCPEHHCRRQAVDSWEATGELLCLAKPLYWKCQAGKEVRQGVPHSLWDYKISMQFFVFVIQYCLMYSVQCWTLLYDCKCNVCKAKYLLYFILINLPFKHVLSYFELHFDPIFLVFRIKIRTGFILVTLSLYS